jgi:predicted AAA+ superfamily ATPase
MPLTIGELAAVGVEKSRDEWIFEGFMPRLYDSALLPTELYRDYFRTYVERDVRQLANLRRLAAFETFVRLLAGRVGQVLNVNALSDDAGVSVPTGKEWLSVMEASYVIYVMRPYYRNFGKRFIKSPKVYFTETGLASYLLGIRSPEQVANHPLMGNLFENMAVMEILKRRLNRGDEPDMYFMRTSSGLEADIVVENGGRLDLYEVKASSTFRPDMTANLRRMAEFIPDVGRLALVYSGRASGIQDGVDTVNFADVGEV